MRTARPGGTIVHFDTIKSTRSSPHHATPSHGSPSVACQHQQAVVGSTTPTSTKTAPHIPSTTDVEHLCQYNKKYLGIKDYDPTSAHLGKTFYTILCSLHTVDTANSIKGSNYCTTLDTISSKIIAPMQQTTPDSAWRRNALSNDTSFMSIGQKLPKLLSFTQAHHPRAVLTGASLDWRRTIPTKLALLRTGFGQPSLAHSFHQEACFETVLLLILKSGHLNPCDTLNLLLVHPLHAHLASAVVHLSDYDFTWLRDYNLDWASQTMISRSKSYAFLACLLHFDLDTSLLMRYLGNNYTGAYRNTHKVIKTLRHYKINTNLIDQYMRVITIGCPNHFVAETSRANALHYWRQGNHSSINQKIDQVMSTINKEERNNYVIHLPHWLWRFVPHIFFTPQHILEKPGRKDRQIFDASRQYEWTSIPINKMTSTPFGSEIACTFGNIPQEIFVRAYNLRITYPEHDIVLHANDVKSAFRQIKHHPDIMGAFSYIIADYLFLQCGQTFGSDFSPANWEVIRQIWCVLAEALFTDNTLRTKHRHYLDRLQWCRSLTGRRSSTFSVAVADSINTGVLDAQGLPVPTPHHVFVDDDIYLDVFDTVRVEQAISASIEAIFILLGKSDLDFRQDPISWDKLEEMIIATCNKVLGLILNTRNMTISIPDDFIASLNKLLKTTWGPHRKSFSAQEAAELAGKLGHASIGAPWLKFMVAHVYTSLASAL